MISEYMSSRSIYVLGLPVADLLYP